MFNILAAQYRCAVVQTPMNPSSEASNGIPDYASGSGFFLFRRDPLREQLIDKVEQRAALFQTAFAVLT